MSLIQSGQIGRNLAAQLVIERTLQFSQNFDGLRYRLRPRRYVSFGEAVSRLLHVPDGELVEYVDQFDGSAQILVSR